MSHPLPNTHTPRPLQIPARPPHKLIPLHQSVLADVPAELTLAADVPPRGRFIQRREADDFRNRHIPRHARRISSRPHTRQIRPGYSRNVFEIDKLDQIPVLMAPLHAHVLMLVREILHRFRETHRWKTFLEEGEVVPPAQEAVGAVDEFDLHTHRFRRTRYHFRDEAPEVLRGRIVPIPRQTRKSFGGRGGDVGVEDAGAEEAEGVVVDGVEGGTLPRAHDVVVEMRFHVRAGSLERFGQVRAAVEVLLFACHGREDHRRFRLLAGADPGQFEHDGYAAGVVVGAGGVVRVVAYVQAAAVVVAGDDVHAIRVVGAVDLRDDVGDVDGEGDAVAVAGLEVAVQVGVHAAVGGGGDGLHFLLQPVAGGADAAGAGVLEGEGVAGAEGDEGGDVGCDAFRGDF